MESSRLLLPTSHALWSTRSLALIPSLRVSEPLLLLPASLGSVSQFSLPRARLCCPSSFPVEQPFLPQIYPKPQAACTQLPLTRIPSPDPIIHGHKAQCPGHSSVPWVTPTPVSCGWSILSLSESVRIVGREMTYLNPCPRCLLAHSLTSGKKLKNSVPEIPSVSAQIR